MTHPTDLRGPAGKPGRLSRDAELLIEYVRACGGVADRSRARRRFTEACVRSALTGGLLVRVGRSGLALPTVEPAVREAYRHSAVISHRSAAAHWGWKVLSEAPLPELVVPRGRRLRGGHHAALIRWVDLPQGEVVDGVTSPVRTVLDCAGTLSFREGLAVADSALRSGMVTRTELAQAADLASGPGAPAKRRVARYADARADNPFESALRAVLLEIPGLDVRPQWTIRGEALDGGYPFAARVDLADPGRRLVFEADSFEFHGGPAGLARDACRYDELVARGWTVLRFTYHEVLARPEWVAGVVSATLADRDRADPRAGGLSTSGGRRARPGPMRSRHRER